MSPAAELEKLSDIMESPSEFIETLSALPIEGRRAVLSFAQFLRQQEDQRRVDAHEAEWDRLFNDPVKMANFTKWADEVCATQKSEPLDFSKF